MKTPAIFSNGMLPAIAVATLLATADAQSADPAKGQTNSATEIQGAFGLKLGDTFDPSRGTLITGGQFEGELTPEILLNGQYEFTPENPLQGFTKYSVCLTPQTHKICSISAVGPVSNFSNQVEVVTAALAKKYGTPVHVGLSQEYRQEIGDQTIVFDYFIAFKRTGDPQEALLGGTKVQVPQGKSEHWVKLEYSDERIQRRFEMERQEIIKSQKASKQREIENKAKALEKSGL